jgi:hypothetical protein
MTYSILKFSVVVASVAVLAGSGCWNSGQSRQAQPTFDSAAGSKALKEFDTGNKGYLDAADLEKVPGLKAALTTVDTNGDGKITADEINARIQVWRDSMVGRMPIACQVLHNGQPLKGATVTLDPEKFLGDNLQAGTGVTSAAGRAVITVPLNDKDKRVGIGPGFYRVRVIKSGENIPPKYNTETVLGVEVAQDVEGGKGTRVFDLQY